METTEEKRATFTPGPWEIQDAGPGTIRGLRFRVITKDSIIARTTDGWKEARANARLIAAAPELLDALKNVKRALRMPVSLEAIRFLVDEAIHKAEVEVEGGEG